MATIYQCLQEAGRALESVVEEQLLAENSDSNLRRAGETSWKENSRLLWWVFTFATIRVLSICRRTQEFVHGTLGTAINGWLMSEGYWTFCYYDNRLCCLPIRDVKPAAWRTGRIDRHNTSVPRSETSSR